VSVGCIYRVESLEERNGRQTVDGDGEKSRVGKRCVLSRWSKEALRPITNITSSAGSRRRWTMRRLPFRHSEDLATIRGT
jgi:hypothetical protein